MNHTLYDGTELKFDRENYISQDISGSWYKWRWYHIFGIDSHPVEFDAQFADERVNMNIYHTLGGSVLSKCILYKDNGKLVIDSNYNFDCFDEICKTIWLHFSSEQDVV